MANVPPQLTPWKPGESGNPSGRPPNAGRSIKERINDFADKGLTAKELRKIASDKHLPVVDRSAAKQLLGMIATPDIADFEPFLKGQKTLKQLRAAGIETQTIRSASLTPGKFGQSRKVELKDMAREDVKIVIHETDGIPESTTNVNVNHVLRTADDRRNKADQIADRIRAILEPSGN